MYRSNGLREAKRVEAEPSHDVVEGPAQRVRRLSPQQLPVFREVESAHVPAALLREVRREAVGDLCLQPRQCDLFVTAELAPYLLDNLTSAGRAHLTLTRIAPSQAERPPQALQELRVTVSSPRLDSVISAAFHLSRGSAVDAVAAGRVNLNDLPCLKPDHTVQENDTVSVRGLGKLRVLALGGLTKKGRLALTLGKYL